VEICICLGFCVALRRPPYSKWRHWRLVFNEEHGVAGINGGGRDFIQPLHRRRRKIAEKMLHPHRALYEQRGSNDGHEVSDWLQAESEVARQKAKAVTSPPRNISFPKSDRAVRTQPWNKLWARQLSPHPERILLTLDRLDVAGAFIKGQPSSVYESPAFRAP
jgi:hypothetical protein